MPTAARLVGGLYFAGLAFIVSSIVIPYLQSGLHGPYFGPVNSAIGFLCGWRIMGPRAGGSLINVLATGLTTAVSTYVVALFVHSGVTMVRLALRRRYDGAVEALIGLIEEAWEYNTMVLAQDVVMTLLAGGMLGGLFARAAARRWS